MKEIAAPNVDVYIAGFPPETQELLNRLRQVIKSVAPEAEEIISYQMPAYKMNGILVYFAGYKNHIGFYPSGSGIQAFIPKLTGYKTSKGTVQFPLNKPIPVDLVTEMVLFRLVENQEKKKRKR
jgi:uncharacterized protein YdhG (YjbR/CyaY superfamily)